jgi:hypothetical protein
MNTVPTDHQIIDAMLMFGGSFVCALAKAYRQADSDNQRTLREAFPELWTQYRDPAMHARIAQVRAEIR